VEEGEELSWQRVLGCEDALEGRQCGRLRLHG
jgi:hypothetical protein